MAVSITYQDIKVGCGCSCAPWKRLNDKEMCPYTVIMGEFEFGEISAEIKARSKILTWRKQTICESCRRDGEE